MPDFFAFSNELLCVADRRGYFTQINPAWTKTFGWTEAELTSRPYIDFVHPDDLSATIREASKLFTDAYQTVEFENRYRCRTGEYRWLAWYAALDVQADNIVASARDVTAQKQQALALAKNEERLQLVMQATADAICDINLVEHRVWCNDAYHEAYGECPAGEADALAWWSQHVHADDRERVTSSLQNALAGTGVRWGSEYRYQRVDGSYAYVHDRALISRDEQGHAVRVLGAIQDVTARRMDEEELRHQAQVIRQLFELQEQERRLVSHDIHDGLAQLIVGAFMQVEAARSHVGGATDPALAKAHDILGRAIQESRRLINDLRPMIIDERGISDSIRHLIAEYRKHTRSQITWTVDLQDDRVNPLFDGVVFRIIQEAISNALRHGEASEIILTVQQEGARLKIEVNDNGRGFDVKSIPVDRFGVRGIIERAKLFRGKATIDSVPGGGTTVRVAMKVPGWSGSDSAIQLGRS